MKLPNIGMGTWQVKDKEVLKETIKAGLEAGYKHIDTAQLYNNEYQIGQVLKELEVNRSDIFITTKVNPGNLNFVEQSTKNSLRRLQTDYIDLLLQHAPLGREKNAKLYKEMMKLRDAGLVKSIGVSNFTVEDLKELHEDVGEWPSNDQVVVSPTMRSEDLEAFAKEKGITLTGYSIMRPYFEPNPFLPNSGMTDEQKSVVDKIAKSHDKDAGQVLNNWALAHGYHIIPKSSKESRVRSNILLDFKLTDEEMNILDEMNGFSDKEYREFIKEKWMPRYDDVLDKGLLYENNFE